MAPTTTASSAPLDDDTPAALVAPLDASPPSTSDTSSLDDKHDVEKADLDSDDKEAQKKSDVLEANELSPMEAFAVDVGGDQSPFAEVAACVSNTDDPDMLVSTFRSWTLLTFFVLVFSGVNAFFSLRYPSLTIGYVVALVLAHPLGKAWAALVPDWRIGVGRASFRLNPGPWTIKEHALVALAVNLTSSSAYALGSLVTLTSEQFWDRKADFGPGFGILYIFTTQCLGFGLAGLARRWIVWPAAMVWPATLPSTVLLRAFHEREDRSPANGWTLSRYRFFAYFTAASFIWFWFPDYLFTALSSFAFITWIWPNSQKVNAIFGMNSGLGLLPISFDWTQITYAGQPLTTPFYVSANCFAAIVLFYLLAGPLIYYKNVWNSGYLPVLSSSTFDNTGAKYNISRVLSGGRLDLDAYQAYSPMYISMAYSISYGLNFAAVTAIVVHTFLYSRKEIWSRLKGLGSEDVHKRLMRSYREVPDWWYGVLTVFVLGLGIFTIRYWDTGLPIWSFVFITFGMGVVLIVPEGILEGTTNQRVFLNILTELIAGYLHKGQAIPNLMASTALGRPRVKMYGYNSVKHGLDFAMDLKLAQYMKLAPRVVFAVQLYSSVLSCLTQTGTLYWMMGHIKDLCSPTNPDRFTCNGTRVVYNASVIWGTIGPQRMFERGQTYSALLHFFWIGPVAVVVCYIAYRRWPNSWLRFVNLPIFFNSAGNIPPANTTQYSLWFITAFIFNYLIRRRAFAWWKRYTYLLSAALDTGTALATIVIFFALSYSGIKLVWWGNTVNSTTLDAKSAAWLHVPKGSHFGPSVGEF
ncbi:hypothetical protein JCM8208_002479 [Rhodotorula glutinis]